MGKTALVLRAMDTLAENADVDSLDGDLLQRTVVRDGQRAGREFRRFLENGARMQYVLNGNFPVWKTVEIPVRTADEWLAELTKAGKRVGDREKDVMSKPAFTTLTAAATLELVKCTLRELGFTGEENLPTTEQIFERIKLLGALCPSEAGPALRLAADDADKFWVAMEPIMGSDGYPSVWYVCRLDDEPGLDADIADSQDPWDLGCAIVFVRRPVEMASK